MQRFTSVPKKTKVYIPMHQDLLDVNPHLVICGPVENVIMIDGNSKLLQFALAQIAIIRWASLAVLLARH